MQLTPRYGAAEPVLRCDLVVEPPGAAMVRQRRRLAAELDGLDADQWATASRCEGWTVQDVVAHLVSTNQFWSFSIAMGLKGEPTTFLTAFDPVATPAELVDAMRTKTATETLDEFVTSNERLAATIDDIADRQAEIDGNDDAGDGDGDGWSTLAEAPPGHLPLRLVVLHALWDGWIHERDILMPLGTTPVIEADEVAGSLVYSAALGPAFLASTGSARTGSLEVTATDPDLRFVIDVGPTAVVHSGEAPADAARLRGGAIDLLEAVSYRAPLDDFIADDDRWMLDGLAQAFDVPV